MLQHMGCFHDEDCPDGGKHKVYTMRQFLETLKKDQASQSIQQGV